MNAFLTTSNTDVPDRTGRKQFPNASQNSVRMLPRAKRHLVSIGCDANSRHGKHRRIDRGNHLLQARIGRPYYTHDRRTGVQVSYHCSFFSPKNELCDTPTSKSPEMMYKVKDKGVFSSRLDEVKAAVRENPDCLNASHLSYPRATQPLAHALFSRYPRSIVKFLLDSGAKATMQHVNATTCWIRKRMIMQHMPNITDEAYKQYYVYNSCGAPRKEQDWFATYTKNRLIFKLTITPELLKRAEEASYTPPIPVKGGVVPGRQGYLDALASACSAGFALKTSQSLCPS